MRELKIIFKWLLCKLKWFIKSLAAKCIARKLHKLIPASGTLHFGDFIFIKNENSIAVIYDGQLVFLIEDGELSKFADGEWKTLLDELFEEAGVPCFGEPVLFVKKRLEPQSVIAEESQEEVVEPDWDEVVEGFDFGAFQIEDVTINYVENKEVNHEEREHSEATGEEVLAAGDTGIRSGDGGHPPAAGDRRNAVGDEEGVQSIGQENSGETVEGDTR